MENIERKAYQPKLGDVNRYENAQTSNRALAEQINKDALAIVTNATSILEKVRKDPSMKNFHDPKTDGEHMGQWLMNQREYIMMQLYGVIQLNGVSNIPKKVEQFVKDVYQVVGR